jgi:hypothetical protein
MIKITEALVSWFRPLKHWLSISLTIKEEDISKQARELLENYWKGGIPVVGVLQEFERTHEEEPKKSTQHLAVVMQKYCDVTWEDIEIEKKRLYRDYNVSSRSQMDQKHILREIDSYTLWTYEW